MPDQGLDQRILGLSAVSEYIEGLLKRQELLKTEPEEQRLITFTTPEGVKGQRLVGERELTEGVITEQLQNRLEDLKGQVELHRQLTGEDVSELDFITEKTTDEFVSKGELSLVEQLLESKRKVKAPTFANITDAAVGKWMRGQPLSDKEQILVNKKLKEGSQEVQSKIDIAINTLARKQSQLKLPPTVRKKEIKKFFRGTGKFNYFAIIDGKEKQVTKDRYNFYIARKERFERDTQELQNQIDKLQANRDALNEAPVDNKARFDQFKVQ